MLSARGPHEHTFLPFSASFLHHALSIAPLYSRALTSPLVPCSSRASRQGFLSLKCRAEPSEGRLGSDGLGSGGPPSGGRGGNREGGGSGGGGRGENNDPWNNSNQPPRSSSSSALKLSRDEVNVCLAGLFLYLVMKYFVVEFRYIPSGSMLPTLKEGDRVIVDKIVFKYKRAPQVRRETTEFGLHLSTCIHSCIGDRCIHPLMFPNTYSRGLNINDIQPNHRQMT